MASANMELAGQVASADDLEPQDAALVRELMTVWREHRATNLEREDYYLGHVRVKDLGIAMPKSLAKKIDPRVDWPRKAVHALADRSIFNGFTCDDEETSAALRSICEANQLDRLYRKNLIGELSTAAPSGPSPTPAAIRSSRRIPPPLRRRCGTTPARRSRPGWWSLSRRRCRGTPSACRPWCTCSQQTTSWFSLGSAARGTRSTASTPWADASWSPWPTARRSKGRSARLESRGPS